MALTFHPDLTLDHIEAAANRLRGQAVRTPILQNDTLNKLIRGRALIKPECLQHTGSFKFRGAYNKVAQLSDQQRQLGVVACSSGNHAQGLARAAQLFDIPATIVMPRDAPTIKLDNTRGYGALVVLYDRYNESREEIAQGIAADTGALFVPPYDDFDIMAGQGTCGLEIMQDCAGLNDVHIDAVLTPASGGGLTAGVATAVRSLSPRTQVFCVEPEHYDDHARSLMTGTHQHNKNPESSICDALLAPTPGERTFAVNRELVTAGFTVSDDEVRHAIRFAFSDLKLVLEPGGAATLAAVMHREALHGRTVAVILSGGNIDPAFFATLL